MRTESDEVTSYKCRTCQVTFDELPLCFGADAPETWDALPDNDRARNGRLTDDVCEIDGQHFFIRGRLEIPIRSSDRVFAWLVWSSLSEVNFRRVQELWSTVGREREDPYFGWLNSALPYSPSTLNLKVLVHTRPVGERPWVELEATDHPLSVEQRDGITWERVHDIVHRLGRDGA